MDAGSLPGGRTFGRARPAMRCGSPVSRISTVISLLFSWGPAATRAAVGGSAHDPRLQEEANILETRRKWIGPSAHLRRREEKVSWVGGWPPLFSIDLNNAGRSGSGLATAAHG